MESSLDDIKKAILRTSEVAEKDIEKIKERIEEFFKELVVVFLYWGKATSASVL